MPKREPGQKRAGWHKSIRTISDDWQLAHYVGKAKMTRTVKGRQIDDFYASKRLLFVSGLPFNKVGEIGGFWAKPKGKIWDEVKAVEKKIADGLDKPNIRRLAEYVHEFLGGYVPLKEIERSFGSDADSPVLQGWIDQLLEGEWSEGR